VRAAGAGRDDAAPAPGRPPAVAPLLWAGPDGCLDATAGGRRPSLEAFTARTGLAVRYLPEPHGDETTWARLAAAAARGAPPGLDLVVLGDTAAARMVADGVAQALDPARLPGLAGVLPACGRGRATPAAPSPCPGAARTSASSATPAASACRSPQWPTCGATTCGAASCCRGTGTTVSACWAWQWRSPRRPGP
jgi:spermidine/putrescine transport system substrate-binding protein